MKTFKPSRLQREPCASAVVQTHYQAALTTGEGPLPPPGASPFPGVCRGEEADPAHTLRGRRYESRRRGVSALRRRRKRSSGRSWEERSQPGDVTVAVPGSRYLRKPLRPQLSGAPSPGSPSEPPPGISGSRRRRRHSTRSPQGVRPSDRRRRSSVGPPSRSPEAPSAPAPQQAPLSPQPPAAPRLHSRVVITHCK